MHHFSRTHKYDNARMHHVVVTVAVNVMTDAEHTQFSTYLTLKSTVI
jgi:hypothetical protein